MKDDRIYLEQIIDCISKIKNFTAGMKYEEFSGDQKTQSAVILQLALIGELSKKISRETQLKIDIPWKQIAGFRDRAIHDYYQIDLEIVWKTVNEDLLILENAVAKFLAS